MDTEGKLYTATKTLKAWPLLRGQYNAYRGWKTPDGEDHTEPGYLVEYTDGGKPNHELHTGYISWSPADVFDRSYKPVLAPHQQRVVDEKAELDAKAIKLHDFFHSATFAGLPEAERGRMERQHAAMAEYSHVLGERIEAFA